MEGRGAGDLVHSQVQPAALNKPVLRLQVVRYFIVGGICALIDLGVFVGLLAATQWHYLIASTIGFILATLVNYKLSIRFVFEQGARYGKHAEILAVYAVSAFSLLVHQGVLFGVVAGFGQHPIAGKCVAMGVAFFWNYLLRKYLVFAPATSRP